MENTIEYNNEQVSRQEFCPNCGRNYELNNIGTIYKPIWIFPKHIVTKGITRATKMCKGSDMVVK